MHPSGMWKIPPPPQAKLHRGFTLIELMVVVAIVAILAALAAPSLLGTIANATVARAVNSFIGDMRYARGEAMRRGKSVTVCRTNTPTASAPVCSVGDGLAVGGWMEGWVVFVDNDGDGVFDAGETILRSQEALTGIGDFYAVGANTISAVNARQSITYDGVGRAIGSAGRWLVHAPAALNDVNDVRTRTLCLNFVGRVRLLQGAVPCPT